MCEAPGRPGKTIGSSAARWLYLQSARNSGRLPTPAGTGSTCTARYALTCAFHAARSTGTQPVRGGAAAAGGFADADAVAEGVVAGVDGDALGDSGRVADCAVLVRAVVGSGLAAA
jgi:hypothetical protein